MTCDVVTGGHGHVQNNILPGVGFEPPTIIGRPAIPTEISIQRILLCVNMDSVSWTQE